MTDLPQILIEELDRAMGKFLDWLTDSRLSRLTLLGKFSFQTKLGFKAIVRDGKNKVACILSKLFYFIRKETIRQNKLYNVTKILFVKK